MTTKTDSQEIQEQFTSDRDRLKASIVAAILGQGPLEIEVKPLEDKENAIGQVCTNSA